MNIIGISAFYHDSAVCLLSNGKVLNAVQEERFTRIKNDMSFPVNALNFCLENNGLTIDDIDLIVFYEKPFVKFERILESVLFCAPQSIKTFIKQMPVWVKDKIFLKKIIFDYLSYNKKDKKLLEKITFIPHHFAHSASAFYPSNFEESAIVTVDGVGEWTTASIGYGKGNSIKILKEMHFPHSLGLFYSSLTYYLGFRVNSDEYKVMGLAPYGNENSNEFKDIFYKFKSLMKINDDGSVFLNQNFFNYLLEDKMVNEKKWLDIFGFPKRNRDDKIEQYHCNMALAGQKILEEALLKICIFAKKLTKSNNLCLAGGVALNCVANSKILEESIFENIWIQPASGDAGGAMGSAFAGYHIYFNQPRHINKGDYDKIEWSYLGPAYCSAEIERILKKFKMKYEKIEDFDKLIELTVNEILSGKVLGWFQGKLEWGPRALGNRSILADSMKKEMQKIVNMKIKFREGFRPFAPAVLEEDFNKIFDGKMGSPYMLLTAMVKQEFRNYKDDIENLSLKDKIDFPSSKFPAVTHIDYSARVQIVNEKSNLKFFKLLRAMKEKIGYGIILNTSFNVKDEPIVCSPEDAVKCFLKTGIDLLVIENFLVFKEKGI